MASHNSRSYKETPQEKLFLQRNTTAETHTMTPTRKVLQFLTILSFTLLPFASPKRNTKDLSSSGGDGWGSRDIKKMNKEFLELHNEVRRGVGVPPLTWDKELEKFAHDYTAQQAQKNCEFQHSKGSSYGENLFLGFDPEWTPKTVVDLWVIERNDYDEETNECKGKTCIHYTQVVWKDTTKLGCSFANCPKEESVIVSCNYSPRGNVDGRSPFGCEEDEEEGSKEKE